MPLGPLLVYSSCFGGFVPVSVLAGGSFFGRLLVGFAGFLCFLGLY